MTVVALRPNICPQLSPQRTGLISTIAALGQGLYGTMHDAWGSLTVRERAGTIADQVSWDGSKFYTILKDRQDLNGRIIESLVAQATAGLSAEPNLDPVPVASTPAERRVARLTEIQASFGLPMRTLAEVLRISRPQLYKWFDTSAAIQLRGESAARLNAVERLAELWSMHTVSPLGPWLHEQVAGGQSLYDLLTQVDLSAADIESGFDTVTARIAQMPKTRSQRMREAGFTRRLSYRALPTDE